MFQSPKFLALLPMLLLVSGSVGSLQPVQARNVNSTQAIALAQSFNNGNYASVLSSYVNGSGLVNYQGLRANRQKLDAFATGLASVNPNTYQSWSNDDKIAFWLNAYNALTLKTIVDRNPRNSIREIPGVFNGIRFNIMGRSMSLDDIEHGTLRRSFNEPRIHMALVCASMSCPRLRKQPYTGANLSAQLNTQTKQFLSNPQNFRIDRNSNRVYVSSIFKWFGKDFEKTYGTNQQSTRLNGTERAVVNFISRYALAADQQYLSQGNYRLSYVNYDWSLNAQR